MVVGEFQQEAEVVVIGGGPGGYNAAFRAAELGLKVLVVDQRDALGGVCLHKGCIPSKTLLHVAETIERAREAEALGIRFGSPEIDLDGVRAWAAKTVDSLARGLDGLCRKYGVERVSGRAEFESSRTLAIRGGSVPRVRFRRAVIATGSEPLPHQKLPFDGDRVVSADDALAIPDIPATLLVVGHDYIAVEIATVYAALGSAVTLVSEHSILLGGGVDADLLRPLRKALSRRFTALHLETTVQSADIGSGGVAVMFAGGSAPADGTYDRVIVATGRRPNIADLGLDHTTVTTDDDGFILIDARLRTADARIHAVGDVTGHPLLADKAIHQGRVCGEVLAGWGSECDARAIPHAIFTDPQVAWCGLTESEAKASGIPVAVTKMPWGASGRAVAMGRGEGVTKLVYDPDTKLVLGVGLAGAHVAEMIAEGALALEMGAVIGDLAATVHAHPTMSELVSQASQQVDDA